MKTADRTGSLMKLDTALRNPSLGVFDTCHTPDSGARQAAYWVAAAIGECRLFGVEPPKQMDGTLAVSMAKAAAEELLRQTAVAKATVEKLGEKFDAVNDPETDEAFHLLVYELVEERLVFWAVITALKEACACARAGGVLVNSGLDTALLQIEEEIKSLDKSLRRERSFLTFVLETNLLFNWEQMVVDSHKASFPGVLDNTLEKIASRDEAEVLILYDAIYDPRIIGPNSGFRDNN